MCSFACSLFKDEIRKICLDTMLSGRGRRNLVTRVQQKTLSANRNRHGSFSAVWRIERRLQYSSESRLIRSQQYGDSVLLFGSNKKIRSKDDGTKKN